MNEADARALLEDRLQPDVAPVISEAEVDRLLARARVTDAAGLLPDEEGYEPTYTSVSVFASVAEGFDMKAAKVAGLTDVKAGTVEAKRSQAAGLLSDQAARYRLGAAEPQRGIGSITLSTLLYDTVYPLS